MMSDPGDLYSVLGVTSTASHLEIKEAYHRKARELHPDKARDGGDPEMFHLVQEAWDVLGDEERRKRYDAEKANEDRHNLWKRLATSEMERKDEEGSLVLGCRCGGEFEVDEDEIEDEEEGVIVECDTCSLSIEVFKKKRKES